MVRLAFLSISEDGFVGDSGKPGKLKVRRAALMLTVVAMLFSCSCSSPVVSGPRHFGIGLYKVDSTPEDPDFEYYRIKGVGALFANGRFTLGYADSQWVHACLEGRSYRAETPMVDFAVGKEAETAGIQFVFPKNHSTERSE